ncbi:Asparagine synthetase B [glutamine-hydrolyzing] [bioreactor metagenome]|jgi:asparagine synthase (glutamine-hydrolysing)|uniref:asparagine synthase (glutamine-hydrolyzing) n=1 Tax=bioreactor metagenome TaxID=1076179 RepID=A0A644SYD3_9ZZZZ
MCGIFIIADIKGDVSRLRKQALANVKRLRHRGPDWSGVYSDNRAILCHERLSIVDINHGAQPLIDSTTGRVLAVNGEIYNHRQLRAELLKKPHDFKTDSDCEPLLYLYDEYGPEFLNKLNGIFAFVIYDPRDGDFFIARDHIGINPLYWGRDGEGTLYIASEMKALYDLCVKIEVFPPGHYYKGSEGKLVKWYKPGWAAPGFIPEKPVDFEELREALIAAVKRQLMCDVPYGLLISGGVDSSLIAAIAAKYAERRVETDGTERAWWPRIHSFSVGLAEAPDTRYAKMVARHIGSEHHELVFTIQEAIDALSDVIYHLETFDVTTIRAGTPMYLMSRKIKAMGIKMILSGEGSDEIFGGYLYFHKAPNRVEFHEELVRKLSMLHLYDCLRANKMPAAWGLEARVPFLDPEFLEVAMNIDPADKMIRAGEGRMEKYILRKAFDGWIPDEILWRQKEQFSDGVGYSWIDSLKAFAEKEVSDSAMANAAYRFPTKTPPTKEAYLYRSIYEEHFKNPSAVDLVPDGPSIACSTPTAVRWDAAWANQADPSGRAVKGVHGNSLK